MRFDAQSGIIGSDYHIKQIAAGRHHSMLVNSEGRVYGCGKGSQGELGIPLHDENSYSKNQIDKGIP